MKTFLLTILSLLPFAGFSQDPAAIIYNELDQSRAAILKPALDAYIAQSLQLTQSIRTASTRKAARRSARQLQENSEAFGKAVATLYGYHKSTRTNTVIIPTANGDPQVALVTNTIKTGTNPEVHKQLTELAEFAGLCACFGRRQNEHADQLEKLLGDLKP